MPGFVNRLMRAMILLDQVVEILHLPQLHVLRQDSSRFKRSQWLWDTPRSYLC